MSGKTFVDANVRLYAYDSDAGNKHLAAKAPLEKLLCSRAEIGCGAHCA